MEIDETRNGSALELRLRGRVDTLASPAFEQAVTSIPQEVAALTMDLADVTYISSAGLRVLLRAQRLMEARRGSLRIVNAGETVSEIFEVTGFCDILSIE